MANEKCLLMIDLGFMYSYIDISGTITGNAYPVNIEDLQNLFSAIKSFSFKNLTTNLEECISMISKE